MPIINQVVKGGGTTPTGTKSITANGVYDVTNFASADVQVPTTAPAHYIEKTVDANGKLINASTMINLNGVTDVGDYGLTYAYYQVSFPANTNLDLSNLTTISGYYCFQNTFAYTENIVSVDLSNLTEINGVSSCANMFTSADLTSINLSNLTHIGNTMACMSMFSYCQYLQSIILNSLTTIDGLNTLIGFCTGCTNLQSIKMNALNILDSDIAVSYMAMAGNCPKLETVEFGGLKASTFANSQTQLQYLFTSDTGSQAPNGCTVHFPSNFDPNDPNHTFDASTLGGYPTFGGNSSYIHVAFDLPATE